MTDHELIDHGIRCTRRTPPTLRLSWAGAPELHCPGCGKTCPALDQRPTPERTHR